MSNRAGISLRDDEIGEYLGNDNLSDVSGLDFTDDLDDEVDLLCSDIGPSMQEVFVSSRSNTPVSSVDVPNVSSASPANISNIDIEPNLGNPSTSTANTSIDILPGPSGDGLHNTGPRPRPTNKRKNKTISSSCDGGKEKETRPSKKRKTKDPKKSPITFPWVNDKNFLPNIFEFDNSNSGINNDCELDETSSNLNFFLELFPLDLIDHIVCQTNLYFNEVVSRLPNVSQNEILNWKPTNRNEILTFLALCVLMSHVRKNEMRDYWSSDKLIETQIFREVMPRNRFQAILRMLHFNNSVVTDQKSLGRLYKINPILCTLNKQFANTFTPSEKMAIDETLFLYKGKLAFRQYIPKKRARFGIKLFVLSDCATGMVIHILPYVGADTLLIFPGIIGIGITGQVVLTLLEPYFGLGHKIYLDNWYVSPCLAMELYKHNTNMCGTVLPDRQGLPKKLPAVSVGEVDVHHTEIMLYERWQDKREVRVLTTMHTPVLEETSKTNWETGLKIRKPQSVLDYNKNMGAVDIGDMELSFNVTARKTIKWYKKLFFHLLDVAIRNAHILKKIKTGKNTHLSDFRKELVREILEVYSTPRIKPLGGRPSPGETPLRLTQRHFLEPIPEIPGNPRPRRKCHVCMHTKRRPSKRQDTYYMCVPCDTPLCIHPCMKDFHTLRQF